MGLAGMSDVVDAALVALANHGDEIITLDREDLGLLASSAGHARTDSSLSHSVRQGTGARRGEFMAEAKRSVAGAGLLARWNQGLLSGMEKGESLHALLGLDVAPSTRTAERPQRTKPRL